MISTTGWRFSLALAQVLLGSEGSRPFTSAERRSVVLFTGTLYLQTVLGLLLVKRKVKR